MRHRKSQFEQTQRYASALSRATRPHCRQRAVGVRSRGGLTLLELLIVIGVMVVLLGLALPIMKTGLKGRQTREASRQLSTYVELAKAHAAETGRPAGLQLVTETLPEDTTGVVRYASRLYLTETPLPYVGDVVYAVVQVQLNTGVSPAKWTLTFGVDSASLPYIGADVGDLIRFGFKGPTYEIDAVSWPQPNSGVAIPAPPYTATIKQSNDFPMPAVGTYRYQLYRQPERSSSMPLELATGAVVDMKNSGFGLLGTEFAASTAGTGAVNIIFNPSGNMSHAIIDGVRWEQTDTIHLLVGRIDNLIPEVVGDPDGNLADPDARWVSIGHQAGKVTVAENGGNELDTTLAVCREFAQSAQSMGGR